MRPLANLLTVKKSIGTKLLLKILERFKVFSRRFNCSQEATIVVIFFRKMTWLISKWSNSDIYAFLHSTNLYHPVRKTKRLPNHRSQVPTPLQVIFSFYILYGTSYTNLPIFEKVLGLQSKYFSWHPSYIICRIDKLRFQSQHKLCLPTFYTKTYTQVQNLSNTKINSVLWVFEPYRWCWLWSFLVCWHNEHLLNAVWEKIFPQNRRIFHNASLRWQQVSRPGQNSWQKFPRNALCPSGNFGSLCIFLKLYVFR